MIDSVEWKGLACETNQGKGLVSHVNTLVITESVGVSLKYRKEP